MIKPNQSDIGQKVIYRAHSNAKAGEGVITRINEKYVFVRFGKEEKSAVTTRDQLEWKGCTIGRTMRDGLIALLGVALGVASVAEETDRSWLIPLLGRSAQEVTSDLWQLGLVRLARLVLGEQGCGSFRRILP
jgi:hypothetical protein